MDLIEANKPRIGIALAFVGCVVPDEPQYQSVAAFSRSGNMFQTNLLTSIGSAGIPVSTVISPIPIQSWPSGRQLLVGSSRYRLEGGIAVTSLSFINVPLLKQLTIGLAVFVRLLIWGWRNRKCKARVVSTYNLSVPPGLFTLIAARLIGAKTVAHLNDINIPGETAPDSPFFRLDYLLQRWLMPRFDGLVVVSDAIIRDFGLRAPHILVEGGVNEGTFLAPPLQRTNPGDFVIVCAGHLDEWNGFRVLLEAFSILRGDHYRLRIAGVGPLENEVRSSVARDPRIEYCGYLAFADVLRLYQSADVLVNLRLTRKMNTRYFFPGKALEYLASGRPVISTCTGHMEEEFGQFTFLLREETPEALARVIEEVARMDRDARERRGAAARNYMMANKTWVAQGRRVAGLIESLVAAE